MLLSLSDFAYGIYGVVRLCFVFNCFSRVNIWKIGERIGIITDAFFIEVL